MAIMHVIDIRYQVSKKIRRERERERERERDIMAIMIDPLLGK